MDLTIDSSRFGVLHIAEHDVIEFPHGLIGLPGLRYTLVSHRPDAKFLWLQSLEDPALALPVVDPRAVFPSFVLELGAVDGALLGDADASQWQLYVTVTASSDPPELTANLHAPLLIGGGLGHQVINMAPAAELRVPLPRHRRLAG